MFCAGRFGLASTAAILLCFTQIVYSGKDCRRNSSCRNGGTCSNYKCVCVAGYKGKFCNGFDGDCDPLPCLNGGQCTPSSKYFLCTCTSGWVGKRCETVDVCSSDPCQNEGTCSRWDANNGYTCSCTGGYSGTYCQTPPNEDCSSNPCQNGGTCSHWWGASGYTCSCIGGYSGTHCEISNEDCLSNPCQNNGTCSHWGGASGYTCSCTGGYSGTHCETPPNQDCSSNPCQNGGTCYHWGGASGYTCSCTGGYSGTHCETAPTSSNDCLSNPCQNSGACTPSSPSGYTCACVNGYSGKHCQTPPVQASPSVPSPELNVFPRGSNVSPRVSNVSPRESNVSPRESNVSPRGSNVFPSRTSVRPSASVVHNSAGDLSKIKVISMTSSILSGHISKSNIDPNTVSREPPESTIVPTSATDLCLAANCHANASCALVNHIANCTCNIGFTGDGLDCKEAVDGQWSDWGSWGECSVTCGSGTYQRTRTCTNPMPDYGGNDCVGQAKEIADCNAGSLCAGAAGYGEWSTWSPCNSSCGNSFQRRDRTCENEDLGCTAQSVQEKSCVFVPCPVDGWYSDWGNWSECSTTCGLGQQQRDRECTEPVHGGAECQGVPRETKECILIALCDGDFGFNEWSEWSSCSASCGPGQHSRSRECSMADPGDTFCQGKTSQTGDCNERHCPIDGGLSSWTHWTECNHACDIGQEETTRSCSNPEPQHGGEACAGEEQLRKLRDCFIKDCEDVHNYTSWSSWTVCSVTCGSGVQSKKRYCLDSSGDGCAGPASDTKECLLPHCPVDGKFTEWSEWSRCPVTCGSGPIHRTRECSNPEPAYAGNNCSGLTKEYKYCSMPTLCENEEGFTVWSRWSQCDAKCSFGKSSRERNCTVASLETCNDTYHQNITCDAGPCPVNGGYGIWSPWSPCSGYCGSGLQNRSRGCSNPEPAYNGAGCAGPGDETEGCLHNLPCSGESGYDEWSQWTLCTQTCGSSLQIRTRKCKDGVDPRECLDISTQTKPCDKGACPVHGNWAAWSSWSVCSVSCGSGVKDRKRSCTNPVPSYGGLDCFENSRDYETCVMPMQCPGDDEFSSWGNWGSCSVTCGEGTQQRSRKCVIKPSYPPSEVPYCSNPTEQTIKCYNEPCLVNGSFTPWTGWSACTTSCGVGSRSRYRNCTNPPPLFRGSDCLGPLYEMKECENASDCPDDGIFSSWGEWGTCSSECEGVMYKTRGCVADEESCQSSTNFTIDCQTQLCPVDGGWSMWTEWSLCSKTCGHQEETRTRICDNPRQRNGGEYCSGHDIEVMPCNHYDYTPCPDPPPAGWSDWAWWMPCTTSCGGGHEERYRLCNNPPPAPGALGCLGERNQTQDCNAHPCAIDGNFSEWTAWTSCSKECENGTQVRGRACINPKPLFGGSQCQGEITQLNYCNVHHCPINGGYTEWSSWLFCNKPCGIGSSDRKRSCTNPTPMYGGQNCTGPSFESNQCNTQVCSPADIVLDVTFNSVTMSEYQTDITSFGNSVNEMVNSVYQQFPPTISILSCSGGQNNKVRCKVNLNYDSVANDELVILQDKLLHPATQTTLHGMTSENVFSSPLLLQATALTSTSIYTNWTALPSSAESLATSSLTGYVLFYKESVAESYQKFGIAPSDLSKTLVELRKFTEYRSIVVCPYSEKGNGIPSQPVATTTLEDVPSVAPVIMNVSSPNSTSLQLTWSAINFLNWHGVPRGYCLRYRESGSSIIKTQNITNVAEMKTVITNLKHFTRYYVYLSGKTTPGCGMEIRTSFVTLEYVPSEPPQNATAQSTKSVGILVKWGDVRPGERNGIIRGYKVSYMTSGVVKSVTVEDSSAREVTIPGLHFLTEYKVKVLAYTSVGDGPECAEMTVTTDESTPSLPPELVQGINTSSSSIHLEWKTIDPVFHRGTLLGYRISYRPAETTRAAKVIEIPNPSILEYELTDLFWWWWYEIRIAGYTRVGTGVTLNVSVRTDEEIPSRFPENIRGVALTTTSMSFQWDPLIPGFSHGVLIGYNLIVRKADEPTNVIVSTFVEHPERYFYVEGLQKYTNYTIWVNAVNRKGEGPIYQPGHIGSTGEDGPEFPPDNIRVSTLAHISMIQLEWTRIPPEYHNGILRGYYIEYTATVLGGSPLPTDKRVVQSIRIRGNRYAAVLRNLDPGSTYEIKIFGYTSKNGTKSNVSIGETCRCPKYLRSNWWVLPPYTNTSNPESPGGIFFLVARQVLDEMCGTCTNGHGQTEFCYEEGCDKRRRRRSTGNNYQKKSLQGVTASIGESVEISFPVQGNRFMTTYAGVFPYISVVDSPGSAYFTVKNVPSTAEVVVNAALGCLPMVLLMCFFAWIAGIIIWILERQQNNEHFPESFTKGVPEGFWWAFISMTTVGYGDRSPVTYAGRIFAMVWILMGLVIISIVTGGIVTSITSVLVVQEDKIYGAQVGAIVNSSEYSKAVRQVADVVSFGNMEDVISAMHNKEIAGALLDMYAAATKKSMFDGGDIQLNRLIEYPTGFGFVLSGNMAKAAPLFRKAIAAKKTQVSQIVEENTDSISLDRNEAEEAKEKSSGLFDPTADIFFNSLIVNVSLLAVVTVAGLVWHFRWYRRKEKKKTEQGT